jgi:hypothetical protein
MNVELVQTSARDRLVVWLPDPGFGEALVDLFFREDGGAYVKEFPPMSVTPLILDRFQRALPSMLRQTARLERVPWEASLFEVARRLDGLDWWLVGSSALAVRSLAVAPRDVDLVISGADALAAAAAFDDLLVEPVVETEAWFSRWFGRAWSSARIEWIAGVTAAADQPEPSDFGLVAASTLEHVRWSGLDLRVPPLSLQRQVCARRGLTERVALIDTLTTTR